MPKIIFSRFAYYPDSTTIWMQYEPKGGNYMQYKHLVCVTGQNNNKYYDMREKPDGTFDATYGRIGATATTINYPMSKWNSTLNSKLRKGYEDMTELAVVTEVQTKEKYKPIEDKSIAALIDYLRQQARETVRQNYTVGSEKVSQAMVNKAQTILNNLSTGTWTLRSFNDQLIELFTVIPRRMGNVRDHLAVKLEEFPEVVSREQQLLDVMAGQVSDNTVVLKEVGDENKTVLEAFGLEFSPATDADITVIKKQLGKECENLFYKAWRVENMATRKNFKAFCKGKGRITKKLFWHGSRTENWWSILRTGLVLRPTNSVINGKMFGYGLYFAPRARKSVGYTSLRGSYWAGGHSNYGFMALYEVVYGKPYDVSDNAGLSDMNYEKLQKRGPGCSCLHAHAGSVLRPDLPDRKQAQEPADRVVQDSAERDGPHSSVAQDQPGPR